MRVIAHFSLATLLLLSGCAISPKHPALQEAQLPELVPVRDFVANLDYNGRYRISPDGKKLPGMGSKAITRPFSGGQSIQKTITRLNLISTHRGQCGLPTADIFSITRIIQVVKITMFMLSIPKTPQNHIVV